MLRLLSEYITCRWLGLGYGIHIAKIINLKGYNIVNIFQEVSVVIFLNP